MCDLAAAQRYLLYALRFGAIKGATLKAHGE